MQKLERGTVQAYIPYTRIFDVIYFQGLRLRPIAGYIRVVTVTPLSLDGQRVNPSAYRRYVLLGGAVVRNRETSTGGKG